MGNGGDHLERVRAAHGRFVAADAHLPAALAACERGAPLRDLVRRGRARAGRAVTAVAERPAWRLRAMTEADLAEIVPIERRAYPFPWPVDFFRQCLRSGFVCRVLERDRAIAGYGIFALEQERAHILNLCVRPALQGRGLGTRLLAHLLALARRRGARYALLEVRPSNYAARGLYRRMGFAPSGVRKRYYPAPDGREDALILVRALRAGDA